MLTFDDIIDSFARVCPKKTVVSDDIRSLSYSNLQYNGSNLATFFKKHKIIKGDRVALLSFNRIEFLNLDAHREHQRPDVLVAHEEAALHVARHVEVEVLDDVDDAMIREPFSN